MILSLPLVVLKSYFKSAMNTYIINWKKSCNLFSFKLWWAHLNWQIKKTSFKWMNFVLVNTCEGVC